MNQMNWSEVMRRGASKIGRFLPLEVLVDGKPTFIMSNEEDVIVIADHHIRVQNMLKAVDKKARAGMPKPTKITAEMS